MKVKIKENLKNSWYTDKGGSEFAVLSKNEEHYGVESGNFKGFGIRKEDCVVLKDSEHPSTKNENAIVEALQKELEERKTEEAQIEQDRGKKYGDFEINMTAYTRVLEAMASQALQQPVKFPDNFGAMAMCNLKTLRECFKHDKDNGLDHYNYLKQAREMMS